MSEKWGKKFTTPVAKKTASKSPVARQDSMKGKDGSSLKGGSVALDSDSEDSLEEKQNRGSKTPSKSVGKVSSKTTSSKDLGKAGKGQKTGKTQGGKGSTSSAKVITEKAELKIEDELPKNAKCLMDCEVAVVLQGIQDKLTTLSDDPAIKMPDSFLKGLKYAETGNHFTNPKSAREALETLKGSNVSDVEICIIGNVCPETVDEVFALLPSLQANKMKNEEQITNALYNLGKLKRSEEADILGH